MICPGCLSENDPGVDVCFSCGRSLTALTRGSVVAARYEIRSVLGKGGMGVVYEAHDRLLDEVVAMKVLRADFGGSDEMVRRFRSEIKLARKVSHSHVCRIHDYGEDGGLMYISMALLRGRDLRSVLREHREGLPPEQAFEMAIQSCGGLGAIHDVGIIHRDLKTANIMLDPDGKALLMDFGIAKDAHPGGSGLTVTGQVMGTPEYMSPEQCLGEDLDLRSDVYSMGIVVWELFTGEVPFRGDTVMGTLFKHLEDAPPFDGPPGKRLPPALVPVLRKALAKDAAQRYASANELLNALRAARGFFERGEAPETGAGPAPAERRGDTGDAGWGPDAPTLPPLPELPPLPGVAPSLPPTVRPPGAERRRHDRLTIPLDVQLRWLGASGAVLQQERTITEAIARDGACVLTAMSQVVIGESVEIEEIGGDFRTRAIVRDVRVGADHRRRLGVEFLDHQLPNRFLPGDYSTPRAGAVRVPAPVPSAAPASAPSPPATEVPPPAPLAEPPAEATPPAESAEAPAPAIPLQADAASSAEAGAEPGRRNPPPPERREHSRLGIQIELKLRRLDAEGGRVEEERTVAQDVSRGGLRVLTALVDIAEGDVVEVEEVDGDFKTRAQVTSRTLGRDSIPRLGIKFLDRQAPDRLVAESERRASGHTKRVERAEAPVKTVPAKTESAKTESAKAESAKAESGESATERAQPPKPEAQPKAAAPAAPPPQEPPPAPGPVGPGATGTAAPVPSPPVAKPEPAKPEPAVPSAPSSEERRREVLAAYEGIEKLNYFDFLGLPRSSTEADVKKAYFARVRKFHPDAARDPALADLSRELSAVFVHLGNIYEVLSHRERRFEYESKLGRERRRAAANAAGGEGAGDEAQGLTPEEQAREAEAAFGRAAALYDDEKYWDAIKLAEWVVGQSPDAALRMKARLLMAEAVIKNPKWRRRGEELLSEILKEDPRHVAARIALGRLYAESGLRSRAEREFRKVLEQIPRQKDAMAGLKALDRGEPPPPRQR